MKELLNLQPQTNIEQNEQISSKIELSFFRHGDKENDKLKDDNEIRLNESGREQSLKKAIELKNPKLAKAYGSPRIRTQETAVLVMDGKTKDIDPKTQTTNVGDITDTGLFSSPRLVDDERLDFNLNPKKGSGALAVEAFKKGEFLKFLAEESDNNSRKFKDSDKTGNYSIFAGNIASIIKDYYSASSRWDYIIKAEKNRKYPKGFDKTLERFMGTHQGINESFLAKIIEKTKGIAERDKFIQILDNKGFDFVEGFKIDIVTNNNSAKIIISYEKKDEDGNILFSINEEIPESLIDEIIEEGNSF